VVEKSLKPLQKFLKEERDTLNCKSLIETNEKLTKQGGIKLI